jgi:DMSO/TMAO reductase YedYZ heme-binding membrane subunit
MTRHETEARDTGRRLWPLLITLLLLVSAVAVSRTHAGAAAVMWLQDFLEFFSGVFALVALTATVAAGVGAAQRLVPIRFRILAQGVHRAMALMAVGFLAAHILLKIMEAHATVLDAVIPFAGGHGRVLYVGLGTIASDLLIVVLATGVVRGRFVSGSRPWVWRSVHALAYVMWPLAMIHGLNAGRPPKWWVTWSYVICFILVMAAAASRIPRLARDRRMLRARGPERPQAQAATTRASSEPVGEVPDAEFWSSLRNETAGWIGDRR